MRTLILLGVSFFLFFLFVIVKTNISGVVCGVIAILVMWKLLALWERKRQRCRCLENAMISVCKIKYMHSVKAKKRCADSAKEDFAAAIECGYKPEKDDRWMKVKQYLDEIEGMDTTSEFDNG